MKNKLSIRFKAAFLLTVFALNTVIGFACAIGVNMGFNSTHHHHDEEATEIHIHANGKKHLHPVKKSGHHHEHKDSSKKDDCCNDNVVKISQADKASPPSNTLFSSVVFTVFIVSYFNTDILYASQVTPSIKYFVRSYHPPIPDIRIAIRSFQI